MCCPDHGVPFPCDVPIEGHWHLEDGEGGWYVVRPFDRGRVGPFESEEVAARMLPVLQTRYGECE